MAKAHVLVFIEFVGIHQNCLSKILRNSEFLTLEICLSIQKIKKENNWIIALSVVFLSHFDRVQLNYVCAYFSVSEKSSIKYKNILLILPYYCFRDARNPS